MQNSQLTATEVRQRMDSKKEEFRALQKKMDESVFNMMGAATALGAVAGAAAAAGALSRDDKALRVLELFVRMDNIKSLAREQNIKAEAVFLGAKEYALMAEYIRPEITSTGVGSYPILRGMEVFKVDREEYFNILTSS